jgi:hypothetical protein
MKQWMTAVTVACATLVAPAGAWAHEGHMHKALGTVASIDGPHVALNTTDGKSLTVMLDKSTTVTRGTEKVDASAIKVGGRISVDYMEEKGMMMARAIKLATGTAKK